MKRCPTCDKTFDDAMRFCQSDGTPLVADEPLDPYKTMLARPGAGGPPPGAGAAAGLSGNENEVLELPDEQDSRKTSVTSEDEIRREMAAHDASKDQVIEIPPLTDTPSDSPRFGGPSLSPPGFGDISAPPPSPFSGSNDRGDQSTFSPERSPFGDSTPPIPSPFGEPKPAESDYLKQSTPAFAEPEPTFNSPAVNPFDLPPDQQRNQPIAVQQWNPPPVQSSWQEPVKQAPAFDRPGPAAGANQTLAIVSLVLGILSIVLCQITGPVAVVTGFMARKRANETPAEYGGAGLALAGIITGVIGSILLVLVLLYFIAVFGLIAGSSSF